MKTKNDIKKYFVLSNYIEFINSNLILSKIKHKKISYSQMGEDLIIDFLFQLRGIKKPTYIDIGAHHPYYLNNTAIFYLKGCRGINIEPDPLLFKKFIKKRKKDINLNYGVLDIKAEMEYYIMSSKTLNTFSKHRAYEYQNDNGYAIKSIKKIPVDTITNIIEQYCSGIFPDFLTIDAEGYDLKILESIDFTKTKPKIICTETLTLAENNEGKKINEIIDFLKSKDYLIVADTFINTIFASKDFWND
jgi:FkbM family methyltransferase